MSFACRGACRGAGWALVAALGVTGAGTASCSGFGTEPSQPVAIELDAPQLPSLVAGDVLRDSTGVAVSLVVRAFNADNKIISTVPVHFLAVDTGVVSIDSLTGRVAGLRVGSARVIASVGGLQSNPITLQVTSRPDTTYALDSLQRTLQYSITDSTRNVETVRVFVGHDSVIAGRDTVVAVPNSRVRYGIVEPAGGSPAGTSGTVLLNGSGVPSTAATTDATGTAALTLRLPARSPIPDVVVVEAVVSRPDASPVPGSPIRFTILVSKGSSP